MSDLISRSALAENTRKLFKEYIEKGKYKVEVTEFNVMMQELLKNQPTAYDVNKLLEENKQLKQLIYKVNSDIEEIINYPHGIMSCADFFPKLREIQDELIGAIEDRQVE